MEKLHESLRSKGSEGYSDTKIALPLRSESRTFIDNEIVLPRNQIRSAIANRQIPVDMIDHVGLINSRAYLSNMFDAILSPR